MWTPVPMRRVEVLVLDDDLTALTERVGQLGALHLIDVAALGDWTDSLAWPEVAALAADFDNVSRRLSGVMTAIGVPVLAQSGQITIAPAAVLERALQILATVEPPVQRLIDRERSIEDEQSRLALIAAQLTLLRPLGVSLAQLRELTFLYAIAGLVPLENLARLEQSLAPIPHTIVRVQRVNGRMLLFAFAPRDAADALDRAMRGAFVEKLEVPLAYSGTAEEALAEVAARREALAAERQALVVERAALLAMYGTELGHLWAAVSVNRAVVNAWRLAGRTARTRLLVGWVPADQYAGLTQAITDATGGRAVLHEVRPVPPGLRDETAAVGREGHPNLAAAPPTALHNPPPLRAFEGLVRTFGTPDYWALDPTPIAALLFVVMFGAMFGDLGQGGILALAGLLLSSARLARGQRDFGVILIACGLSSMVFGLLYGSFFAREDVLSPLWARPIEHIQYFIQLAIGFGVLAVSLGLILGIITAWRQRDLGALAFGHNGLAGLWLYWGLIVFVALFFFEGASLWLALLLVGVPLVLLFLHGPLSTVLGWHVPETANGSYYVQAGVESFDLIVRLVSNTVSFLRIAAFALSHAGLGITIVTLATMLQGVPGASLLTLILGNALIVLLEGLIVGIQALRLEYYEFFTKFLAGRGVPFRPFLLAVQREERA